MPRRHNTKLRTFKAPKDILETAREQMGQGADPCSIGDMLIDALKRWAKGVPHSPRRHAMLMQLWDWLYSELGGSESGHQPVVEKPIPDRAIEHRPDFILRP